MRSRVLDFPGFRFFWVNNGLRTTLGERRQLGVPDDPFDGKMMARTSLFRFPHIKRIAWACFVFGMCVRWVRVGFRFSVCISFVLSFVFCTSERTFCSRLWFFPWLIPRLPLFWFHSHEKSMHEWWFSYYLFDYEYDLEKKYTSRYLSRPIWSNIISRDSQVKNIIPLHYGISFRYIFYTIQIFWFYSCSFATFFI